MLRGAHVKLVYRRQDFQEVLDEDIYVNDDLPCTKVFQQFGIHARAQKFFTGNGQDRKNKGKSNDAGTTVEKYFRGNLR